MSFNLTNLFNSEVQNAIARSFVQSAESFIPRGMGAVERIKWSDVAAPAAIYLAITSFVPLPLISFLALLGIGVVQCTGLVDNQKKFNDAAQDASEGNYCKIAQKAVANETLVENERRVTRLSSLALMHIACSASIMSIVTAATVCVITNGVAEAASKFNSLEIQEVLNQTGPVVA